jgi:hypothetical protein
MTPWEGVPRILDSDAVESGVIAVAELEALPIPGDDRIDRELVVAALEAQNFFEPDAIGPGRRGPCTTSSRRVRRVPANE